MFMRKRTPNRELKTVAKGKYCPVSARIEKGTTPAWKEEKDGQGQRARVSTPTELFFLCTEIKNCNFLQPSIHYIPVA